MNVTYRVDKDILYIALEGRIDATNAAEAEEKIFAIKNENPDKHTVIDADKLEYISSAGLRVILRL
nr:STAS domain-containing protein [Bacteroidales bacterium]